jgi:FkbM family methyltransferase
MNFSTVTNRSVLGRVLRFPLQKLPSNLRIPVLQGALRGRRWIVGSSNHGFWLGSYEYSKQRAFSAVVRRGYTVFDLGAHVGFYSLLASVLVGPEGRVISFEPVPRNLGFLRRHLALNKIENCSVWEAAVGISDGTASFETGPNHAMGHLSAESSAALNVRTVRLDTLVTSREIPSPDLIKLDIEGGEYDALMGASDILVNRGPTILLATHGREVHQACCKLLLDHRYQLKPLDDLSLDQTSEVLAVREKG